MITTRRTAVSDKDFETKQNTVIETDFQSDFKADTTAYVDPVIKPLKEKTPVITRRITPSDSQKSEIMPTIRLGAKKNEEKKDVPTVNADKEVAAANAVDGKTKALMMTYVAVAFVLALVVLATGFIVTNRTAQVANLQNDVRTAYDRVIGQEDAMNGLSDKNTVSAKADNLGMKGAGGAEEIELVNVSDEVTYEARTNGFDRFCDFISRLIGG